MSTTKQRPTEDRHIVQVTLFGRVISREPFLSIYNAHRRKSDLEWEYRDHKSLVGKLRRGYTVEIIEKSSQRARKETTSDSPNKTVHQAHMVSAQGASQL